MPTLTVPSKSSVFKGFFIGDLNVTQTNAPPQTRPVLSEDMGDDASQYLKAVHYRVIKPEIVTGTADAIYWTYTFRCTYYVLL